MEFVRDLIGVLCLCGLFGIATGILAAGILDIIKTWKGE